MSSPIRGEITATSIPSNFYYLGGLDGLRLLAFLLVFGVHLPAPAAIAIISTHGWVGVELFFAISAFLLFRLLDAENRKYGHINVRNFYLRRILRIYPLLIAYYGITFISREGFLHPSAWTRFGTTLASVDNIVAWWSNYNYTIQGVGHLWTLSFEFQVYLLLPLGFLAWKKWGTRRFLWGLLAIEIVTFAVRFYAIHHGAPQVGLYVIPYFRPESILAGLALAVTRPRWHPALSFVVAIGAGVIFFATNDSPNVYAYIYLPVAVMAAGLVDASVRFPPLRGLLGLRPIRYLGTISYGLYVLHIAAIYTVVRVLQRHLVPGLYNRTMIIMLSLALTIVASAISYRYLERPFLQLKRRFTAVEGRSS